MQKELTLKERFIAIKKEQLRKRMRDYGVLEIPNENINVIEHDGKCYLMVKGIEFDLIEEDVKDIYREYVELQQEKLLGGLYNMCELSEEMQMRLLGILVMPKQDIYKVIIDDNEYFVAKDHEYSSLEEMEKLDKQLLKVKIHEFELQKEKLLKEKLEREKVAILKDKELEEFLLEGSKLYVIK